MQHARDTNFKGSDSSDLSVYFLFCDVSHFQQGEIRREAKTMFQELEWQVKKFFLAKQCCR